jgi:hypothetical protein
MAQAQPQRVYDGFVALPRGIHSGRAKTLLPNDQLAFATNATFRGDLVHNRPGWSKVDLDLGAIRGRFQGAHLYEPISGDAHLLTSIGGHIYKLDILPAHKTVTDISISGDPGASNLPQSWFCSVPGWCVIQDGQARAQLWDGSSLRRANTAKREVPVGTAMAYGNGRLWAALPDRRSFVASDLIYTDSGTAPYGYRDSVLRFTENEYLTGGGSFGVPVEAGSITGMKFVGVADTSTGQGPLLIGTERSTFSVNAPFDRQAWATTTSPLQTVPLPNGGPTGPWCMAGVNGDVWYRDRIGIRSVQSAVRDFGRWTNTPLSRPMRRVIEGDDRQLLQFCSAVEFDNRLLCTVTPQRDILAGVYHLGLAALDFDQVSDTDDLGLSTSSPVWDGLWTGLRILQVVTGRMGGIDRCFIFAWNLSAEEYELWELSRSDVADENGSEILWTLESPDYAFGTNMERKDLKGAKLWLQNMSGAVRVEAEYKPDDYPVWQPWHIVDLCAPTENCGADACGTTPLQPQSRNPIQLPTPSGSCRQGQRLPTTTAYTYSVKLSVTGAATIGRMRLEATPVANDYGGPSPCQQDEVCEGVRACPDNPFLYLDNSDGAPGLTFGVRHGRDIDISISDAELASLARTDAVSGQPYPLISFAVGDGYVYIGIPTNEPALSAITSGEYSPGNPIPVAMADQTDGYMDVTNGLYWAPGLVGSSHYRVYRTKNNLHGAFDITLT